MCATLTAMLRIPATGLLMAALSTAPFQCASSPDPDMAREETPGQALYALAGEFKAAGKSQAWRETLEFLVARYPSSRFAEMARQELAPATP